MMKHEILAFVPDTDPSGSDWASRLPLWIQIPAVIGVVLGGFLAAALIVVALVKFYGRLDTKGTRVFRLVVLALTFWFIIPLFEIMATVASFFGEFTWSNEMKSLNRDFAVDLIWNGEMP